MRFEFILAFLSFIAFLIVNRIDEVTSRGGGSPRMQAISKALFSSYRRTIAVYLICMQGTAVAIVLATLPSVFLDPLIIVVFLFVEGLAALVSIGFAKIRVKTLHGSSWKSPLQLFFLHQTDSLCLEELFELSSKSAATDSASIQDLLAILDRDDVIEWLVEQFVELGLSTGCIDELLWKRFFDRFEETPLRRPRISLFSRKEFQKYRVSRGHLLRRDDEIGRVFRESLSRWSMQVSGVG